MAKVEAIVEFELGSSDNWCWTSFSRLVKFAFGAGFEFKIIKNCVERITAVCKHKKSKNSLWRIYAYLEKANNFFVVRTYKGFHNYGCEIEPSSVLG